MRIVIQLKKGIDPDKILMQLYKTTDLQTNFNVNNVTLIEKGLQPRTLNIKELLLKLKQLISCSRLTEQTSVVHK